MNDRAERVRSLEEFANTTSQGEVVPAITTMMTAPMERIVGAQQVAVRRDEAQILRRLAALGAAAGEHWYYRYPVKNRRKGTTDYIEGPSIKLANDLARIYGNNEIQTRVIDCGDSWLIYARFNDIETGYALERPVYQSKDSAKIGGDDDSRRVNMSLQIGVSLAVRNVTCNALQTFADEAFAAAKQSLVEKIGKNLKGSRERIINLIAEQGIELSRVETVISRPVADWTAPDIAKVIAMTKAIADGMATVDETFPPREHVAPEPVVDTALDTFSQVNPNQSAATVPAPSPQVGEDGSVGAEVAAPSASAPDTIAAMSELAEGDETLVGDEAARAYINYARAWISECTSAEECQARWTREKGMRNQAKVGAEDRDVLEGLKKQKVTQLKSKSGGAI